MRRFHKAVLLGFCSVAWTLFLTTSANATITPYISFQGKLTNPDGTNVTDTSYSVVFSIYTVSSGGSAVWTETKSVTTSAGLFQTNLGDTTTLPGSVNFNSNALYLGVKVGSDAEMTPRVQLTAAPQAFNADNLGGISSAGYIQLSPGTQQSGFININGAITSGAVNGLTLAQAADGFTIAGGTTSRTLTVTGANITIGSTIQPTAAGALTIQSNGANTITLATPTVSAGTGAVSIMSGNASAGIAGNVTIDTGTTSTGTPTVNIANANAKTIQIGNNTSNPSVTIDSGTGTIAIGSGAQGRTVSLGTGGAAQLVSVGSTNAGSSLTLQAGTGGLSITTQGTGTLGIGNNAVAQTLSIGNSTGATAITIAAGTGGLALTTQGTGTLAIGNNAVAQSINIGNATGATSLTLQSGSGGLVIKPITANATALTIQDSGGAKYLVADTTNTRLYVGDPAGVLTTPAILVLATRTTTGDPTEVDGGMYYNSTDSRYRCGQNGVWLNCNGLVASNTAASAAVNTCTAACAAFSTNAPIPANYCQPGRVIHLTATGVHSTTVAGPTLSFGVYYGTDAAIKTNDVLIGVASPTTPALTASLANVGWQLDYYITCFSTTTMNAQGWIDIQNSNTTTTTPLHYRLFTTTSTTVTTTTAKNLYIFPAWGTSNAGNTATIEQLIVGSN
jgi:hypothetical protein